MKIIAVHNTVYSPQRIWLVGSVFVLFQFFLQLSSGVIIGAIMQEMQFSASIAGVLSSVFYLVYTTLQIPVGIFFDHYNVRNLLTFNALLCSIGCLVFTLYDHLFGLFLGRMLMGAGAAFAFVGLTHLIRQYFVRERFAFLIGLSETLGFIATVLGIIGMGTMIMQWGWRSFMQFAALLGLFITLLCWRYIPNITSTSTTVRTNLPLLKQHYQSLKLILANKTLWVNGLFIGLSFTIVTVFGALWAASFIEIKLQCSLRQASLINAMFFLGTGFSCPLFGGLSGYFTKRKPLIILSSLLTASLLLVLLYLPIQGLVSMAILMFSIGLSCGAYLLAYPIANELAPAHLLSTCTGFTNTLALVTTPLLQPLIGFILDANANIPGHYSLANYQQALLVIPISLLSAGFLSLFLPEKNGA